MGSLFLSAPALTVYRHYKLILFTESNASTTRIVTLRHHPGAGSELEFSQQISSTWRTSHIGIDMRLLATLYPCSIGLAGRWMPNEKMRYSSLICLFSVSVPWYS